MGYEFETTSLWKSAFLARKSDGDAEAEMRNYFRASYLKFREKAALLVINIPKDLPGLTIHDVTHLDALWETASLIAGETFSLNPAEAFVLGGAILLHDCAMSIASYSNGLAELRETVEWKDIAAAHVKRKEGRVSPTDPDIERLTIPDVLRARHAAHAEKLATTAWLLPKSRVQEYIIDDVDLRQFYGPTIGRIARSHWLSVNELQAKLPKSFGAISKAPASWRTDPLKIACLLRLADAAHIDEKRAPRFLRTLVKPEGISDDHWNFQSKMAKATSEGDAVIYSSGPEFALDDADAWWVCYDTASMIDRELHDVDILLENLSKERMAIRRVKGIESPKAFSEYVRTRDWRPVNAQPKVSDVPSLVRLLGGKHLYGNNLSVPVRELVQNAADSIRAKRLFQTLPDKSGEILICLRKENASWWLDVVDNGIGMSERVLTGPLLDFGRSFWSGSLVREEFPGLTSKGLNPTGKYGIGFFSVFMLGDAVQVTTRRTDAATENTFILEFRSGLDVRPILRQAQPYECLVNGGTKVSVRLAIDPYAEGGMLHLSTGVKPATIQLKRFVAAICPALDVTVNVDEKGIFANVLSSRDWVPIDGELLLNRLSAISDREPWQAIEGVNLREMSDVDGTIYGRAAISDGGFWRRSGVVTVGGFVAAKLYGISGILIGETSTVTRSSAMPIVPPEILSKWATEQALLISSSKLADHSKLVAAATVMKCGGEIGDLPITEANSSYYSFKELVDYLKQKTSVQYYNGNEIEYDEDEDSCHPKEFSQYFAVDEELFFVKKKLSPDVLTVGNRTWPTCILEATQLANSKSFEDLFAEAVAIAWEKKYEESEKMAVVGYVDSTEITRKVTVFVRALD